MELMIKEFTTPAKIEFNYEEIRDETKKITELYKGVVYTAEEVPQAKETRAKLNSFVNAIDAKRKEIKKAYTVSLDEFEKQIKEIEGYAKEASAVIDAQISAFEKKEKEEKQLKIKEFFNEVNTIDWLEFDRISDPKWLNVTSSMKSIQEAINTKITQINNDINVLSNFDFKVEAIEFYKKSLDMNKAINQAREMIEINKKREELAAAEKAKEEAKSVVEETPVSVSNNTEVEKPVVSDKRWVSFQAYISNEDGKKLRQFCNENHIDIKSI